jgi:hypothetical protein
MEMDPAPLNLDENLQSVILILILNYEKILFQHIGNHVAFPWP